VSSESASAGVTQAIDAPAGNDNTRQFGLGTATALVIGTIIGVGIFNLPSSLAFYGPISLVSMALTTVGALALAMLFAALSRRLPADGGPYAYARAAFGNRYGFANAWSYWITAWGGNSAIAVGWVLYVEHFINTDHKKVFSILLVLAGLWGAAAVNLSGVKNMGSIQVVTTILKFFAVGFMATVGLFYIDTANYSPFNISGESALAAIGGGMAIALFSYIGVEAVSVAAGKVRNPDRNVPRSTLYGTLATAVVYMLSMFAVFGILPSGQLTKSTEPFSAAANTMFGGTWAGDVMAVLVIISGIGALNGWTMICAEMPLAAANDGLFPERFQRMSKSGVPAFGIVASTSLASVAIIVNYAGSSGSTAFTTLVLMTGITAAIPYAFSALAQIKWTEQRRRAGATGRFALDITVAVLSLVFSILFIWYSRNTGQSFWLYWAPFLLAGAALLFGIPVYMSQRARMTEPAPPPAGDAGRA
jgi:APA family basic amino acid/polyamine antiporter